MNRRKALALANIWLEGPVSMYTPRPPQGPLEGVGGPSPAAELPGDSDGHLAR